MNKELLEQFEKELRNGEWDGETYDACLRCLDEIYRLRAHIGAILSNPEEAVAIGTAALEGKPF